MDLKIDYILKKAAPITDLPLVRPGQSQESKDVINDKEMTFGQAFKKARNAGEKIFEWHGKKYTTELKEELKGSTQDNKTAVSVNREDNVQPQRDYALPFERVSTFLDRPDLVQHKESERQSQSKGKSTESSASVKDEPISSFKDVCSLVLNGIKRKWALYVSDAKKEPQVKVRPIREAPMVTGDTTRISKTRYSLPEIIDLSRFTYGARNRGEYDPIDTEAGVITTFNPFSKVEPGSEGTYIGIDDKGHLILGDSSLFGDNSVGSRIFSNTIFKIRKNESGYEVQPAGKGNVRFSTPVVDILDSNGNIRQSRALNILLPKEDTSGTTYGNATGGRVIIRVGNELKLVSGSLDTINTVFEDMKKRNNADRGIFYTLDNGTYARAIRTYNSKLTPEDLKDYDLQNTGGGNFLYIK